jgi:hypothetical protein
MPNLPVTESELKVLQSIAILSGIIKFSRQYCNLAAQSII